MFLIKDDCGGRGRALLGARPGGPRTAAKSCPAASIASIAPLPMESAGWKRRLVHVILTQIRCQVDGALGVAGAQQGPPGPGQAGSAAHSSLGPAPHILPCAPRLGSTKAPGSTKKSANKGRRHHHALTARTTRAHCRDRDGPGRLAGHPAGMAARTERAKREAVRGEARAKLGPGGPRR